MSWHDKTFPCPVSFNADVTRGFVGLEVLDQKVGGQLKVLKPLLKFYLNRKIKHNTLDHDICHADYTAIPDALNFWQKVLDHILDGFMIGGHYPGFGNR